MPDAIKAALTTELAIRNQSSAIVEAPKELQYMPPGTHRINASRNGKPVTLDITVDASTADRLNQFLQDQLTKATEGNDDRPFFDFNHEDREAAAWPTEFYWAGDDPKTGGVRAKIEWSGAGEKAFKEKTFRRFSPTFVPDEAGHVIGSETNMGGLVNRAAFKSIAPLFAKGEPTGAPSSSSAPESEHNSSPSSTLYALSSELQNLDASTVQSIETRIDLTLDLVQASWSDDARAASERARRALGWPGLSQTWGDGHGGAGPITKLPDPIIDPPAPDPDAPDPLGDEDPDFRSDEERAMDEYRKRQQEREERLEREERPSGDGDPDFQDEERRSMDEHRERERQRQEEDARSEDEPGQTFEEIASDPEALGQLSDQDLQEFQYFTEGQTRRRFEQEEARRREIQVLPKADR